MFLFMDFQCFGLMSFYVLFSYAKNNYELNPECLFHAS
jgi:hypothetical protein